MKKNVKIVTRTYGKKLHEYCKKFIDLPYEIVPIKKLGNKQYMEKILSLDADFIINIDEDCFIYDNNEILDLMQYMIDNNYDYCGVPDGGIFNIRHGSPIAMNPFFNIFDLRKIRQKFLDSKIDNETVAYKDERLLERVKIPLKSELCTYALNENYYPIFYWLARNFNPLYLNGFTHTDEWVEADGVTHNDEWTSVVLSHRNKKICYHTWLARFYQDNKPYNGKNQRVRINKLIYDLRRELDK